MTFKQMFQLRRTETVVAVCTLSLEQRRALYDRFITWFDYSDLLGDDISHFNPSWSPKQMVYEMFEADTFDDLFNFLIEEKLMLSHVRDTEKDFRAQIKAAKAINVDYVQWAPSSEVKAEQAESLGKASALMGKMLAKPRGSK